MGDDKDYTNVILEEIRLQMRAVLEIVSNQPTRAVVDNDKTTRHELELLDRRVTELEESAS